LIAKAEKSTIGTKEGPQKKKKKTTKERPGGLRIGKSKKEGRMGSHKRQWESGDRLQKKKEGPHLWGG